MKKNRFVYLILAAFLTLSPKDGFCSDNPLNAFLYNFLDGIAQKSPQELRTYFDEGDGRIFKLQDPKAVREIGDSFHRRGNIDAAIEFYTIAAENNDTVAMYNLGITFSQESKKEDAFSWNKKAAEKKHPNAAYFVALKYHADKNTEKALSWAEKSFEYGVIGGMGLAGSIHQGSGDHEKAISCFKKLLSKDEANHEVMTSMGFSYLALHKTDEALQSFNKAVSLGNMKALAVLMELQSIE